MQPGPWFTSLSSGQDLCQPAAESLLILSVELEEHVEQSKQTHVCIVEVLKFDILEVEWFKQTCKPSLVLH